MRHGKTGRHLARTSAHSLAMRRNMAQSLFQHGQIRTTLIKAKEIRSFVEKLITLARKDTLEARRRVQVLMADRSIIPAEHQEAYDGMSDSDRLRVLRNRSGKKHRAGVVPVKYNKKKYTFVASMVSHKLINEIAPRFKDRPGGYTRIIRLPLRRIGDATDLAILQLVGNEQPGSNERSKTVSRRREKTLNRIKFLEGKTAKKKAPAKGKGKSPAKAEAKPDAPEA